jgi:hypothetical protein
MSVHTMPTLTYRGRPLDVSPQSFGLLRPSNDLLGRPQALRNRMEQDGYLFLPGLLDRAQVLAARSFVLQRLQAEGSLDPAHPVEEGIARPGLKGMGLREDIAAERAAPIERVLYSGRMVEFFESFLGEPVRHYDYTWLRCKSPGDDTATTPHCDVVYMGRGTRSRLFTAWTPMSDIPWEFGGLMVLEGTHSRSEKLADYWSMDVDTYCTNRPEAPDIESGRKTWENAKQGGSFNPDAVALGPEFGARWLSAEYRAGDVLVFCMHLLHASLDNQTRQIRISTDSRYQPASEPVDERWVGDKPIAHGPQGKTGMIC